MQRGYDSSICCPEARNASLAWKPTMLIACAACVLWLKHLSSAVREREGPMIDRVALRVLLLLALVGGALALVACGGSEGLYVPKLLEKAQEYNGKDVIVDGAYIGRGGTPASTVLALGVSTLDNGLDAQPVGEQIW